MGLKLEDVVLYAFILHLYSTNWSYLLMGVITIQTMGFGYIWLKLGECVQTKNRPRRPRVIRRLRRRLSVYNSLPSSYFNPLINETWKISELDRIRISLNAVTIFPVRFLLVLLSVAVAWLFGFLATLGLPNNSHFNSLEDLCKYMGERGEELPEDPEARRKAAYQYIIDRVNRKKVDPESVAKMDEKALCKLGSKILRHICWYHPFPLWRRLILQGVRLGVRMLLFSVGYLWIETVGELSDPKEAPILVSNHVTMIDPAFMTFAALPSPIGAVEHLKIPTLGTMVKAVQAITVDRNSSVSRKEVKDEMVRRTKQHGWPHLLIYPEATCTNGEAVITFKTGAFNPGVPVQLIHVKYSGRINPGWVGAGPSLWHIVFRLMCEPVNYLRVDFGPIYIPNAEERSDSLLYSRRVREQMSKWFNLRLTSHSYDDVLFRGMADKLSGLAENAVIEADAVRNFFGMKLNDIKKYYAKFDDADSDKDGLLSKDDFLRGLGIVDQSPQWGRIFDLLDDDGDGFINFRVYLIGMAFANTNLDNETVLRTVHKIFDSDDDGYLSVEEFTAILHKACPTGVYTPAVVAEIFEKADTDKDGKLTVEEFIKYASENPKLAAEFQLWRRNFSVESNDTKEANTPAKEEKKI